MGGLRCERWRAIRTQELQVNAEARAIVECAQRL